MVVVVFGVVAVDLVVPLVDLVVGELRKTNQLGISSTHSISRMQRDTFKRQTTNC